jgi:RNA polymerase sigma factor (sigma-70 family)
MHTDETRCLEGSEGRLVQRCIGGKDGAWDSLFHRFQPRLIAIIQASLGRGADGRELAEEIAASVWYSLVLGDGDRLRRFDPNRGAKLLTYLAALARQEIRRRYRRERSRFSREARVARVEATAGDDARCDLVLEEFLATLSPREREFCLTYLLDRCAGAARPVLTEANNWKLRSRVMHKLRLFAGERGPTGKIVG